MELLFAMAPQGGDGGGQLVSTLIMLGAIFAVFYFITKRSNSRGKKVRIKKVKKVTKINGSDR